jgi:23S rRNA A2030 N6-methylase RlmJ
VPEGLNGCGVLVFNTPFQIPERLAALAPELVSALGYGRIESYDLFS